MIGAIPYRPSNGTEGEIFMAKWCNNCARAGFEDELGESDACLIVTMTFALDITDPDYPKEWRRDGPSGPRCTAFTTLPNCDPPFDSGAAIGLLL